MEYTIENMKKLVEDGMTCKEIGCVFGKDGRTISYHLEKHGCSSLLKHSKPPYVSNYFNKIDTKEKAYIIGFLSGDGSFNKKGNFMSLELALGDKCITDFVSEQTGARVCTSTKTNREKRRFPRARMALGDKNFSIDFNKYGILTYKNTRKIPNIKKELQKYLIQGFFDAEGCITWGIRKDRYRVWQSIKFTSSLSLLYGIQKILDTWGISTAIKPKQGEDCYVVAFSDLKRVNKFLDIIYPDSSFIVLNRKYKKAIALRRKLGELRETSACSGGGNPEPSFLS